MNREIKNDGVYIELDADELIEHLDEVKKAQVVVVTKARIEMAGDEKDSFVSKFEQIVEVVDKNEEYRGLDAKQKSDLVLRSFLV